MVLYVIDTCCGILVSTCSCGCWILLCPLRQSGIRWYIPFLHLPRSVLPCQLVLSFEHKSQVEIVGFFIERLFQLV